VNREFLVKAAPRPTERTGDLPIRVVSGRVRKSEIGVNPTGVSP
jgi:hypothetical protein